MDCKNALHELARVLPKAELHLHLEGTLEPEMLLELAERNGVSVPFTSADDARRAYDFENLQDFLDLYYRGTSVLATHQDFYDLTMAYLRRAAADGVRHVEPFFDPQAHTSRGVGFDTVLGGIVDALRDGEADFGISWRLIMCFLRDLSAEDAMLTLEKALPHQDVISAVGLDSTEVGNPPEKFEAVFARALDHGFLTVAHAGEEGTPADVRRTLDVLHVSRIDHGVHALDDPELVSRLVSDGIALTVCPLSNVKLRVFEGLESHNLREMLDAGIVATVNSDDPAYFGGYLLDNYRECIDALELTREQVVTLARNSFTASFLGDAEKAVHLAEIEQVVGRFAPA